MFRIIQATVMGSFEVKSSDLGFLEGYVVVDVCHWVLIPSEFCRHSDAYQEFSLSLSNSLCPAVPFLQNRLHLAQFHPFGRKQHQIMVH